jgi:2-hydroxycyclohexanecarboxyl-CoA dehydrogenase
MPDNPASDSPAPQRVALVTGAGRGIGQAIACRLAADGKAVAVADLNAAGAAATVALIEEAGGRALAVEMDVTDGTSVGKGVVEIERALGSVGILVNNAGWDEPFPFLDTDEPFWERVVDINYAGVLRTTKATLPGMVDAGWGRIVNIGSDAARIGSSLEAVYAGAKGAVIAFTKTIAREAARGGVTANVVCPGPTMTPLIEETLQQSDSADKLLEGMRRAIPMKRLGDPTDIAAAVRFFAGEDTSFITGQTLSVSGGLTMA